MANDKIERQNIFLAEGNRMPPAEQRPMNYTGVRVERYATIRAAGLTPEARRDAIQKLNAQERRALRLKAKREAGALERERVREAEERRREAEREAERRRRAEEVRVARNARRRERRADQREVRAGVRRVVDIQRRGGFGGDAFEVIQPTIMTGVERLVGQGRAYMQIVVNGEVVDQQLINLRGGDTNAIYWNSVYPFIFKYIGGQVVNRLFENDMGEAYGDDAGVRFTILLSDVVPAGNILQRYRDGVKHCVLEPLAMLWKKMGENSESVGSAKRCFQISRRLEGLKTTYPDGVPEGMDMEVVARCAHRCLVLHDILGNEIKRYNEKSPKYFHFTNTRINHLEQGHLTLDKNYERVSLKEITRIMAEHDKDDVFYLYSGDLKNGECRSIRSVRGCWAVYNDDHDLFVEFSQKHGIQNYGVDAVRHKSLNEFMLESRIINSAPTPLCDTPNDLDGVQHIDVEKAYTQHRFAPVYRGFLGHITDFVKLPFDLEVGKFLEDHVGVYKFSVLNEPCELLGTLGIRKGKQYILPSVEIEYMMRMGLVVRLIAGAWGSVFDIDYTDEMLENRRYCIWAGKLGMDNEDNTYTFKGDEEWARCLKNMLGEDAVFYFSDMGMMVVRVPKKSYQTKHHILAFITSYTRMNLLETMQKVEGQLVKVVLDGLYYRGEMPDIALPIHKNKKGVQHVGFRDHWYYPAKVDVSDWEEYEPKLDVPRGFVRNVCVLTGAGGTGKSYSVLMRKSIPRILYVVPTNVLGQKKRTEFNIEYTTIDRLVGIESGDFKCRAYREDHREPAVVFVDEGTMIDVSRMEKALALYPSTKFYYAADVDKKQWFQCRNGHPGAFQTIWMPTDKHHCVEYVVDHRSRDEELKEFKRKVRFVMREVFTDGGQMDANRVASYVRKNYKTTSFDDAVAMFRSGDIWIAGTHKTNQKLLDAGVVSGYFNKQKEIVAEGDGEARGSFTTHSFQGLTLATERVFVSLDFFEYAMLYTSISRVCRMSQLIIVA